MFDVVLMDISVGGRRLLMVDARLLVLRAELRWLLPEAPLGIISAAKRTPFRLPDWALLEYVPAILLRVLLARPDVLAVPPWPVLARIVRWLRWAAETRLAAIDLVRWSRCAAESWLAAIDLVATLDTLSSLTEAGWWFPGRLPSSLSLSLVTWDRVLRDVVVEAELFVDLSTHPDVFVGCSIYVGTQHCRVEGSVVPVLNVTLALFWDADAKSKCISDRMIFL